MSVTISLILVGGGIAILASGADLLVRGAVSVARVLRVPSAVIGLTIVAMGTSLPELTVGVTSSIKGAQDIGVGNIVGVNVFNIAVVLGIAAIMQPMRVHGSAVRLEWPFMFLATFLLLIVAQDGVIGRMDGIFMVAGLIFFTAYVVRIGRRDVAGEEAHDLKETVDKKSITRRPRTVWPSLGILLLGMAMMIGGGEILMRGAIDLARSAGMTERIIGLTIVAFGTGSTEVATAIVAARRNQSEIALANVIGSNIANILGVLGITAILSPLKLHPSVVAHDIWWTLAFALILFPLMRSDKVITRGEGIFLLIGYAVYLTAIILAG